ncbi:MAG TPA: alpha-amylase family protein, partial [Actinomycetota bacterium]|nr:alpha-amylase family protein [Actinomycetota bacterium]
MSANDETVAGGLRRRIERGAYFDAWFPGQHNYHPSLPPRRLRMIDHLDDYRATMLVWSALGGGNIALPYLEEEAFGEVPPRYRVYGFVNDSEFIAECGKRGIKVFGVVFEHAWEYPVELDEGETTVLALNETRDAGRRDWLGMREFWQDRYPNLWPARSRYFPEPLLDADGNEVTDILEECAQRNIHGEPLHALWIECPDREHWNYMMDRNNPVWREYLKAIVRLQIDAGVHGVHFDEAEVPLTSLQYGGCFCPTCMRGFREYLRDLPEAERPAALEGANLDAFHYGEFLLERGFDFRGNYMNTPLFHDYMRFQRANIRRYFAELAEYARGYARSKGRDVLISGNFFNLFEHYYPLEPAVDVVVTEMRNTLWRQPEWYRYAAAFGRGKPVVVVENPYGGVVMEIVEGLKRGRLYDRFRQSLYEAAALGVNMSVPYGAWMGSVVEDAFYPPHDLATEIQTFLGDHERLFAGDPTFAEVGVVYGIESNAITRASVELPADNRVNALPESDILAFDQVSRVLAAAAQPYDVLFFPDGALRPDTLTDDELGRYRTIVVPAVDILTERQAELLETFVAGGGRLVVLGDLGTNLGERMRTLLERDEVRAGETFGFSLDQLVDGLQIEVVEGSTDAAATLHRIEDGAALHLIRYDHDDAADRVPPLDRLVLDVRLPFAPSGA